MLIMPISSVVHYKCAFDIVSSGGLKMNKIQNIIFNWLKAHSAVCGRLSLSLHPWFKFGSEGQEQVGDSFFRVAINKGDRSKADPENWLVEFIHKDSSERSRLWCIVISLTRKSDGCIRFTCVLKHAVFEGWVGQLPDEPQFSVPRVVKNIVSAYQCVKSDVGLQSHVNECYIGNMRILADGILNRSRVFPFVVLVTDLQNKSLIDLEQLQGIVIGNANVYHLPVECLAEFNSYVPAELSLRPGMLRIFSSVSSGVSSTRHRYFVQSQIELLGQEEVLWQLGVGLSRNFKTFIPNDILSVSDVIHRRRIAAFERLKMIHVDSKDEIGLYKGELDCKNDELNKKNEELEECREESKLFVEMYDRLEQELKDVKSALLRCNDGKNVSESTADGLVVQRLPASVVDVLRILSKLLSDKIVVHESAFDSAESFSGRDDYCCVCSAWRMVFEIGTTLHGLFYSEKSCDIVKKFKETTGIDIALSESSQTQTNKKLMRQRMYDYDGDVINCSPHIKGGKRESYLRIHFAKLDKENKIIICYCGKHLDTYGTKRRKL